MRHNQDENPGVFSTFQFSINYKYIYQFKNYFNYSVFLWFEISNSNPDIRY